MYSCPSVYSLPTLQLKSNLQLFIFVYTWTLSQNCPSLQQKTKQKFLFSFYLCKKHIHQPAADNHISAFLNNCYILLLTSPQTNCTKSPARRPATWYNYFVSIYSRHFNPMNTNSYISSLLESMLFHHSCNKWCSYFSHYFSKL